MRTARQVKLLADVLDQQGKRDQPITVIGSRRNLRKHFPADKRGGPLWCREHYLQLVKRAPKGEAQNADWVEQEAKPCTPA